MSRVLFISKEKFASEMAGPAIRTWEMAKHMAQAGHEVTLASNQAFSRETAVMQTVVFQEKGLSELIGQADVFVIQNADLLQYNAVREAEVPLVLDLYDPFTLENLEVYREFDLNFRNVTHQNDLAKLKDCVRAGDYFLCANERQRDFWLGFLASENRINPSTYDQTPTGDGLIGIVPFGLTDEPEQLTKQPVVKGKMPGIETHDRLLIWSGGIWNWFDPLTLIHAMKLLQKTEPRAKLLFLGYRHPDPAVPLMTMAKEAKALSDQLGLTNSVVFFNETWIPYDLRHAFLLEADLAVCTHAAHLETRFSFRTRLLDALWTDLPMVVTEGDTFAEWVDRFQMGYSVQANDPSALAERILQLLRHEVMYHSCVKNIRMFKERMHWQNCIASLDAFCKNPRMSGDGKRANRMQEQQARQSILYRYWLKIRYRFKQEGIMGVFLGVRKWLKQR